MNFKKSLKYNLMILSRYRLRLALTPFHLRGLIVTLPPLTVYHLHLSLASMTVGDRPKSNYNWVINPEKRWWTVIDSECHVDGPSVTLSQGHWKMVTGQNHNFYSISIRKINYTLHPLIWTRLIRKKRLIKIFNLFHGFP
jgi:hypothetical protein